MNEDPFKLVVDIDRSRIREIVEEALRMMHEFLQEESGRPDEHILKELDSIINSNMVASWFFLTMNSKKIPDLVLRVNPIRREVLFKSAFKKKVARLNHFVSAL